MKYTFLFCLILVSFFAGAQNYKPAVKLSAGKKYTVVNTGEGNMTQEAMGQTMDIPISTSVTSLLEVKNSVSGGYEMSNTNTKFVMSISAMGQDMSYDSDKKEDRDGPMGKELNNLIGKPGLFTINDIGKIIKTEAGPEDGAKNAGSSNPMLSMMNLSATATGSPLVNLFINDAMLQPGQSFTDSTRSEKTKTSFVYTLTGVKDGIVSFAISGEATATIEQEMQGMQTVTNTTTKSTGEMLVSTATGLLIKKTLINNITGTVEVAGMSIPLTGKMTNTVIVTEVQ